MIEIEWAGGPMSVMEQVRSTPEQIEAALKTELPETEGRGRIAVFGIGDSMIPGEVLSDMADEGCGVRIMSISEDRVPGCIGEGTDCIVISYSGDTPETVLIYNELRARGCRIFCISSGGILLERAAEDGCLCISVPGGMTSEGALGFMLGSAAVMVQSLGYCDAADRLSALVDGLKGFRDSIVGSKDFEDLALSLLDCVPAVYSTSDIHAVSKRWKMALCEHSGELAFSGELPEFDHNELVGWSDGNVQAKEMAMVVLTRDDENETVGNIVEYMGEVLNERGREVTRIHLGSGCALDIDVRGIILGDALSLRMGELRGGGCRWPSRSPWISSFCTSWTTSTRPWISTSAVASTATICCCAGWAARRLAAISRPRCATWSPACRSACRSSR